MPSVLDDFRIDGPLLDTFAKTIQVKTVKKGTILQQNSRTAKAFFVQKGCLRSYTIDAKGKEHIFMFAPEGWILSDVTLHAAQGMPPLFVDALEDSEIEVFDGHLLDELTVSGYIQSGLLTEKLFRRIAVLQKRVLLLMSANALERYKDFIETYPNIVQRVPQRMIASYLGITPEALSKIRNERVKK